MSLTQATLPTGRVQLNDVYNTEYITRAFRDASTDPLIGQRIVKAVPLDESESYTYQVPIYSEIDSTLITTVAANAAAPEAAMTTDQAQITGARRALRMFVLDETANKVRRTADVAIRKLRHAHRDFWHRAIMDLFPNITNDGGSVPGTNATNNTLSNWDSVTGAFRAQNPDPGPLWSVMSRSANRDLRADLVTNAASLFGTAFGEQARDALASNEPGVFKTFDGYMQYESGDVPAGDTTGFTCAVGVAGEEAAMEFVQWGGAQVELQRDAARFGTWIVTNLIAGVGIVKQANTYAYIVRA
jgi:uncharacterized protein YbaA (DUF1428 family)